MKNDLKGKVAIVTGAASGIGKATAKALLENFAVVVMVDVADERGRAAAAEFSAFGHCEYVHADISRTGDVDHLMKHVAEKFGAIDILVNNAGVNVLGDFETFALEDWQRVLAVDLTGAFYCSQVAVKTMRKQQSATIINIGSVMGIFPARKQSAYTAAKAGLHQLTRSMALELAPYQIRVNAIAPGSIRTEGTRRRFYGESDAGATDLGKALLAHVPLARPGECEEIADSVLFLASAASRYITGHVLVVDGGWTCSYSRDF